MHSYHNYPSPSFPSIIPLFHYCSLYSTVWTATIIMKPSFLSKDNYIKAPAFTGLVQLSRTSAFYILMSDKQVFLPTSLMGKCQPIVQVCLLELPVNHIKSRHLDWASTFLKTLKGGWTAGIQVFVNSSFSLENLPVIRICLLLEHHALNEGHNTVKTSYRSNWQSILSIHKFCCWRSWW